MSGTIPDIPAGTAHVTISRDAAMDAANKAEADAQTAIANAATAQATADDAELWLSGLDPIVLSMNDTIPGLSSSVSSIGGQISTLTGDISTINNALAAINGSLCKLYHLTFDQTTTNPTTIVSAPVQDTYVPMIIVAVNTAADGAGASITVGASAENANRYLKATDVDLEIEKTTVVFPITITGYGAIGTIDLYITPGGRTFAGEVFVLLSPITAQGS